MGSIVLVDKNGSFVMPGDVRYDADDSAPTYVGVAADNKTPTNSPGWTVYKYSYSGSNVTRIQKINGAIWDNRASLDW